MSEIKKHRYIELHTIGTDEDQIYQPAILSNGRSTPTLPMKRPLDQLAHRPAAISDLNCNEHQE